MNTETHQFQAEVRQLLDIVINALYSDREIFVRELVSNASDALEKLRLKQLTDSNIYQPEKPLEISITTDKENKTITIADTGIGMTEADLVENLGTIAHSGTKKFMEALKQKQEGGADLIGQFGVGFYSSFMVADQVEVFTHSWEPEAASLRWTSNGREGYSIETLDEPLDRGTRIVIHLKDEYEEFSQEYRVKELLRRYSNFVGFPINFNGEHINTVQAIWSKSKSDVKPEEYDEFYQFISHTDEKPLSYMHFSADAPIMLNALLFIPKRNPEMFGFGRVDANVSLYCKRVLIDAKPEGLLPEWLRFLNGVVDSEDLPLNISREMLQDNSLVRKISDIITKRFIKHLDKLARDEKETYKEFYGQFSRYLKEGVVTSWPNKESLGKLLRFESTATDAGKTTSFEEYITRMKEGQTAIYALTGLPLPPGKQPVPGSLQGPRIRSRLLHGPRGRVRAGLPVQRGRQARHDDRPRRRGASRAGRGTEGRPAPGGSHRPGRMAERTVPGQILQGHPGQAPGQRSRRGPAKRQ